MEVELVLTLGICHSLAPTQNQKLRQLLLKIISFAGKQFFNSIIPPLILSSDLISRLS